jgi:integrase/recombinase XerD
MESYFREYLTVKGMSKQTVEGQVKTVARFRKWTEQEAIEDQQISNNDVMAYIKYLQHRGIKQLTVQLYINSLKHYFRFLQNEAGIIAENPVENIEIKGIKRRHLYDLFTEEELTGIYQNYQANGLAGERNKNILGLMIYQGLRTEELARLTPSDLKLREGKIRIVSSRRTNGRNMELRAFQIIDLQDYIYTTRNQILELMGKQSDKLFVSLGSSSRFNNIMQKLMQALRKQNRRIKHIKQIRASVITNWLKHYNLRKAQIMAGHRYVSSTEMYQIGNLEDLQSDIEKFHPIG